MRFQGVLFIRNVNDGSINSISVCIVNINDVKYMWCKRLMVWTTALKTISTVNVSGVNISGVNGSGVNINGVNIIVMWM